MTERAFPRLQHAVEASLQEQRREQSEDSKKADEEKRQLMAVVSEYHFLKSSPLVKAMKAAGFILAKASRSEDVLMYITQNPEPKDDREWDSFHKYPDHKLDAKVSVALIWDIRTDDYRGRFLKTTEWKEISASVRKNEAGEVLGFNITSNEGPIETDLSEENIFEAVDKAASSPVQRFDEQHKKGYEALRIRFQRLIKWGKKWELEGEFREEQRSPSQPERTLILR